MRFEVPQFIEVEDKIFGPLTWKQFAYIAGGFGAGFILFVLLPFILFVILATPVFALAIGLSFYQVNNRPLSQLLESMVLYLGRARLYLWKKQDKKVVHSADAPVGGYALPTSKNSIASLSRKLEINALQKK